MRVYSINLSDEEGDLAYCYWETLQVRQRNSTSKKSIYTRCYIGFTLGVF